MSSFPEEPSVLQLEYGSNVAPADINVWHQDHSWRKEVTQYELSNANVTPPLGGNVLYADATEAYRTLSPLVKKLLEDTTSLAVLANGYQNLEACGPEYAQTLLDHPPIPQPIIAFHPETNERWLNVNAGYSFRIPELSPAESDVILPMLCAHVTKPEHCLRLQYNVGDIVIFDNHRLQQYAVSDYYPSPRRIMRMSFNAQNILDCSQQKDAAETTTNTNNTLATKDEETTKEKHETAPCVPALSPSASEVAQLATQLAAGLRLLSKGNQSDLCAGFFSARLSTEPTLFLAPSHGTHWSIVIPNTFGVFRTSRHQSTMASSSDAMSCDALHERIAGKAPMPNFPSTAVSAVIYAAFPEVNAIVHAHPRSMMALVALDSSIGKVLPISEPSFMFFERVAYLPCNSFFDNDYLDQIIQALHKQQSGSGGAPPFCIVMRNHSYIMVGQTLEECYLRCYMLEQSASIQLAALSVNGGKLPPIPDRQECLFHRRSYEGYNGCAPYDGKLEWPGLVRGLDTESPEWSDDSGAKLAQAFEKAWQSA